MPTIACPSCRKTYKISQSAVGKTANCKCGKKFRLGNAKSATPAASATPNKPKRSTTPKAKATSSAADDDFWDDEISTELKLAESETTTVARAAPAMAALAAAEEELEKKKNNKVRWGFRWDKVLGGGLAFFGAGLATLFLVVTTGRVFIYLAVIAIVGLFTMLSGLMGEEAIWGEDEFD